MKFISLFSGIGGLDLGLERAGMECVLQVEIDDYCNKVLEKHWPTVKRVKDVLDVKAEHAPTAELIAGGFPCQDVSVMGKKAGLDGKRSTLWSEFYRLICEVHPKWVVIENVRGLLSINDGQFFRKILWELSREGYDAEWDVIQTGYTFGLPHSRERIFIVAYPHSDRRDALEIFDRSTLQDGGISKQHRLTGNQKEWGVSNSDFRREVNGIPDWVDRLRGCGNAVVPQVAEWVGKRIMDIEAE